jgi:hypothetical protein
MKFNKNFSKNTQLSSFKKIRQVAAELFHADNRHDETNSPFSQICERA